MRIAYLVNQYPKVSHTFVRREILALEKLGLSIDRISIRSSEETLVDPQDQQERDKTYVVLAGGMFRLLASLISVMLARPAPFCRAAALAIKLARRGPQAWKHLAYLAEAAVLVKRFLASDVSHLHAHFGTNSATVALLCEALGGPPFSFTVHGPEEFDRPERLGLDLKIGKAGFVVAISDFGRSQLMRWCSHQQWHKLHVIHCGVDESFLKPPLRPITESPRLVCIGRLCEQKGHGILIEAATRLAQSGIDFELVLVGDGPLRPEIETLIDQCHLDGKVRITGWMSGSEVTAEILAARALVLPSFAEGLPVVIMESLALGRPVISTYIAGIPELVTPGICGWLVPAGAVEPLCDSIREVLDAPVARLENMGKMGSMRVSKDHCSDAEAAKLARLFCRKDP